MTWSSGQVLGTFGFAGLDVFAGHFAPVLMRITYAKPVGYEVREARLTCIVGPKGNIVDARADEEPSAPRS